MALSQEELQIAEYGKKSGKSQQDVLKAIDKYRSSKTSVETKKKDDPGIVQKVGNALISNEKALGEDIAAIPLLRKFAGGDTLDAARATQRQTQDSLIERIKDARSKGQDDSKWVKLLQESGGRVPTDEELFPALKKSTKQVVGDVAGVAADILTAGSIEKAGTGVIKAVKPAEGILQTFKTATKAAVVPGAVAGGAQGASGALQQNKDIKGTVLDTLIGTGVGAATAPIAGAAAGTLRAGQKAVGLAREAGEKVASTVSRFADTKPVAGAVAKGQELVERVPRFISRIQEASEKSAAKAARIKTSTPAVQNAIKSNLDDRVINTVVNADQPTKKAYKQIADIAKKSKDGLTVTERPSIVAGKAAGEQFAHIEKQKKAVGKQIGEAVRDLSRDNPVSIDDTIGTLQSNLESEGITFKGNKLTKASFSGTNFTPAQRSKIAELWKLTQEAGTELTPYDIWKKDNLFSQLKRDARFEGISDILVETADGNKRNLFDLFRDTFRIKLDEVSPADIRKLNKEYRDLLVFTDDIENSILKGGNFESVKNVDPAEFAQTNLRRIMSDAQSAGAYQAIVKRMDDLSRKLGYQGARPEDLINFAEALRRIYPESVPKTSFQGGIRTSLFDIAGRVLEAGTPDARDQQKALEELLDEVLKAKQ